MFLRRNRRTVNVQCYKYWTLVKTVRTAREPRQQLVAALGKEPGLESRARWLEEMAELLVGLRLELPSAPKTVQNVVEKNGW